MEEYPFAGHPVIDKAVPLGFVIVCHSAGTHASGIFEVFKLRCADQDLVGRYGLEFLGIGRRGGDVAILIHISKHVVEALAFVGCGGLTLFLTALFFLSLLLLSFLGVFFFTECLL